MRFNDRIDAGRRLGAALQHLRSRSVVVLGLPRGGVPVAAEVARALGAPLDVLLVRKLGVPFQPEVAMGAIAEGGVELVDRHLVRGLGIYDDDVAATTERELHELQRRAAQYRGDRPAQPLAGRTVVVVDDGVATGSTARAACIAARMRGRDVGRPGHARGPRGVGGADRRRCRRVRRRREHRRRSSR